MAMLTIRNLPESTRRALKARAARHNQSMEAEVRSILVDALDDGPDLIDGWLSMAARFRSLAGDDFVLPERA